MSVPSLKKIVVNGFPLLDISLLLDEYTDALSGVRDKDIKKVVGGVLYQDSDNTNA